MLRLLAGAILVLCLGIAGTLLVGRAIDHELEDRVIITRHDGRTIDCARIVYEDDSVFYDDCHTIVAP
jgi:hypothetical protein